MPSPQQGEEDIWHVVPYILSAEKDGYLVPNGKYLGDVCRFGVGNIVVTRCDVTRKCFHLDFVFSDFWVSFLVNLVPANTGQ